MDIGTGLTVLGAANLIEKLLGPTAEYIGVGVKNWAENRTKNVKNIFEIATRKLGSSIETKGSIPPKVLKIILDDGSFADNFLAAEYFGGILASARSEIPRDDRAASFGALVTQLSAYQIRAHYIFHSLVKEIFNGKPLSLGIENDRRKMRIFISWKEFNAAMDFTEKESPEVIVPHVIVGLEKEALIGNFYTFGEREHVQKEFPGAPEGGLIIEPGILGIELFIYAQGMSQIGSAEFLDPQIKFEKLSGINLPKNALALVKGV